MSTVGEVCEVIAGQSPPSATYNRNGDGLPFFQGKADFGELSPTEVRMWCSAPQKIAEEGDVLISVRAPVGPTNLCDQRSCIGRGLSAIRPGNRITSKYLLYFLRHYEPKIANLGRGSTFSSITQKDLKKIPIYVPALNEQKRIVFLLDQADALRCKRRESMELLDQYVQAVFMEMFGDPVTNPKGWPKLKLSEIAAMKRGPFGGALKKEIFVPSGYAVYEQAHAIYENFTKFRYFISEEKYAEMEGFSVKTGQLIVSCSGTLGKIAEIPDGAPSGVINQALLRLNLDQSKVLNEYFKFIFRSPWCQNTLFGVSRGSGISNFPPMSVIKSIEFPVPDIASQKEFIEVSQSAALTKDLMVNQESEIGNQFNSMMQQAFSSTA